MAGKQQSDITGLVVDNWKAIEYLGKSNYLCKCSLCGNERSIGKYFLVNNKAPKCECQHGNDVSNKGRIDLTGKIFGSWKVLEYAGDKKWLCECQCSYKTVREVAGQDLRNGKSTSCGKCSSNAFIDLTGKQFGDWKVLRYVKEQSKWECECQCENKTIALLTSAVLRSGASKSCGHSTTGFKDLTGKSFGSWRVIGRSLISGANGRILWECECLNCGNKSDIDGYALRTGSSKSCGCMSKEYRKATNLEKYGVEHLSQFGTTRTSDQLESVKTKESLSKFIETNFDHKPSAAELAEKLGIARGSIKSHLIRFGLMDKIQIGTQQVSGYEKQIAVMYPCEHISDRNLLEGKEVDLYYPDKKFAIEFNGNYWHSDLKKEDIRYHQQKTLLALSKNVQLFHIFEYEWTDLTKRKIITSILSQKLYGDRTNTVYARECSVKSVNTEDTKKFLNDNHLQGYASSSVNIGLYYNNELFGIMTFGKPRFNTEYDWELIRLCFKLSTVVVGGAERMFQSFIKEVKPRSIVSYCNIAKFTGEVYNRLGFKYEKLTQPNYVWIDLQTYDVLSRYQTSNQELTRKGLSNPEETEDQTMRRLGYHKIYDCGNFVFIWDNPSKV